MRTRLLVFIGLGLLSLSGCAAMQAADTAEPSRGSLTKTYRLIDEDDRVSGTLVLHPMGKAELRDADGRLLGVFTAEQGYVPEQRY